jgi:DME family drug/metabolite transporter
LQALLLGVGAAFLSALCFGLNNIIVRIGTLKYSPRITVPSTLFLGMILITILSIPTLSHITMSTYSLLLYMTAGFLSFGIGRYLFYISIMKVGATATGVMISGNVILTGLFGALLLHEPSRPSIWIGLLLFTIAVFLASEAKLGTGEILEKRHLAYGLTTSVIVASANIVVRAANIHGGSPLIGLDMSYLIGFLFHFLLSQEHVKKGVKIVLSGERIVILMGTVVTLGQVFRYLSLNFIPAVLSTPVVSTSMFYTIALVGFFGEAKEKPTLKQAIGVIIGFLAILILYLK